MGKRVLVASVCCVLALAGCAGVPSSGPVRVVRRVPAEGPDLPDGPSFRRNLPPNPPVNARPADIVRGFLFANAPSDSDLAIARKYLAPGVSWDPAQSTTVYSGLRIGAVAANGDTATVEASWQRFGTISADGEFRPPLSAPGSMTFKLRRAGGEWRLANAPQGALITRDALKAYQRVTLYFPNASRRLVPHQVFLRSSDQPAASVVRALLARPRGWLAPSLRSALPAGTELLDPPTVVDGVVTVNLSREVRRAPQDTIGMLIAQVTWTLTEPALAVDAVRLLAEGEPLVAPERPDLREHRRTDWEEHSPLPRPFDERLFFVRDAAPYAIDPGGAVSRVASLTGVRSFAVNRAGTHLAAVTRLAGGREALVVSQLDGSPRQVLTADRITAPTWEPGNDVVWAAATNDGSAQVVAVPVTGSVAAVPATLPPGRLESLRLSPDGSRVALVVEGRPGRGSLWVARVERTAVGGRVIAEPRAVAPSVSSVTAAAFDGVGQIVLAGVYGSVPTLVRLDVDGFNLTSQRVQGLPAGVVAALTSSTGTPPDRVASVAGRMYRRTPGADWAPIAGTGTAATYAG